MKQLALSVISIISIATATAQTDSTKFDLGYTSIEKKSTQYLTIMAKDLQQFPFSTLEEAINIYFNGVFTTRNTSAYIIDGNISTTIDALSIYDIESITLILNAQTLINSTVPGQQLIVIKTRSGFTHKSGITAAASGYLTNRRDFETGKIHSQDKASFYQQYNIRGTYVKNHSEFGASVNFLREAFANRDPEYFISSTPSQLNRFRLNTWFNTSIGKSILTFRLNASPQDSGFNSTINYPLAGKTETDTRGELFVLNPSLRLFTQFSPAWTNDLNISYIHSNDNLYNDLVSTSDYTDPETVTTNINKKNKMKQQQLLIRNKLAYEKRSADWTIVPSLGFVARINKIKTDYSNIYTSEDQQINYSTAIFEYKYKEIAVTPSVSVAFKEIFFLQSGVQYNNFKREFLSSTKSELFPFASASFDILKAVQSSSSSSLKVFASYTKGNSWKEWMYYNNVGYFYQRGSMVSMPDLYEDPATSIALGAGFNSKNNKFNIQYTYEKIRYAEFFPIYTSFPPGIVLKNAESTIPSHRLTIGYHAKNYRSFINVYKRKYLATVNMDGYITPPIGGFPGTEPENFVEVSDKGWAGGWVNNFQFDSFTAGFNVMYNENKNNSSILLQHIYLGYNTKFKKHNTELFISSRNLVQNKKSGINTGYKVYYGLGINFNL